MQDLKSRKFLIALVGIVSASILVANNYIGDSTYGLVCVAAITGYLTANVLAGK